MPDSFDPTQLCKKVWMKLTRCYWAIGGPCRYFSSSTTTSMASMAAAVAPDAIYPSLRALSIQSHTIHGYVGNKAATFPLQCLGVNVDAINTVTLSNHPRYPAGTKGKSMVPGDIDQLIAGLEANTLLGYDLVLTGYTSSLDIGRETAAAVNRVLTASKSAFYVCDPVLGDDGRFYVPQELTEFFKTQLLPLATVVTPNQFEAEVLSGIDITSFDTAREACNVLHSLGPKVCILKGLQLKDNSADDLSIVSSILIDGKQQILRLNIDRVEGKFSGCGDLFSAIAGGLLLLRGNEASLSHPSWTVPELASVLEGASEVMSRVVSTTHSLPNSKELRIVENIDVFVKARSVAEDHPCGRGSAYLAHSSDTAAPLHTPTYGVLFDMDGTLTEPGGIDFGEMYTRTGFTPGSGDIVSWVNAHQDPVRKKELNDIIIDVEMKGCDKMKMRPDLHTFFAALRKHRIRTALATRNCIQAFDRFLTVSDLSAGQFSPALARESLPGGENKPDPAVAQYVIQQWGIPADQAHAVWFVGDSDDDMKCGKAAGMKTCLIINKSYRSQQLAENRELVDLAVETLSDFGRHIGVCE